MTTPIGWKFPPTNGGRVDGFNDPGIAHFNGAPLSSLARETIQNSLDASWRLGEPVHVTFELIDLTPEHLGRDELVRAINASKQAAKGDAKVENALEVARQVLERNKVPCLRVSDRNTTGLRGEQWRTLVKRQGVSFKPDVKGAGGSHGIGKYAPFAVSALRTVFYWTCYEEEGTEVELLQGKSVLMSHDSDDGETQGTGFYGIKDRCTELTSSDIPERFRLLETGQRSPVHGTSLYVAGFHGTRDWRRRIASSVIENFFYAIKQDHLKVIIDPDQSLTERGMLEMDRASLANWFDYLEENATGAEYAGDEDGSTLKQARVFWQLGDDGSPPVEKQDADLGHCRLWIRVQQGLPSKVAFVRRTGMLVTTQQRYLMRFPGCRDFAALCVFEDPLGNELLRNMENPQHDQFEPDRLSNGDKERGRRALKRITDWIRAEVRKAAAFPEGGTPKVLSELAAYLPDLQPDEPFDHSEHDPGETNEPGFGERLTLKLRPVRRPIPTPLPPDENSTEEGEGEDGDIGGSGGAGTGTNEGDGGTGGSGEGEGQGGTGGHGGGQVRRKGIPIVGVRILSIAGRENCYRLSFLADGDGAARLELEEAGDSSTIRRDDVRAVDDNVSLDSVALMKGERTELDITADGPIGGRAWRLLAVMAEGD